MARSTIPTAFATHQAVGAYPQEQELDVQVGTAMYPQMGVKTEGRSMINVLAAPLLATVGAVAFFLGRYGGQQAQPQPAQLAMVSVSGEAPEAEPASSTTTATADRFISSEQMENLEVLQPSELEEMYIDALWAYYKDGKPIASDEDFEKLKMELNWQGSGFPTLHREEVEFVEAVLAYYRGEPIVSDEEYEKLKASVKADGKRQDVTSFLLLVKARQVLKPEELAKLQAEMTNAGVSVSPAGLACTLSQTPNNLQYEALDVLYMYSALGLVPSALCSTAWGFLGFIVGGLQGVGTAATLGFPLIGASSFLLTRQMVRYLDLTGPNLVTGVCPCCETEIKSSFFDVLPRQKTEKCPNCGTIVNLDAEKMLIQDAAGFGFVDPSGGDKKKSVDQYLSWASGVTSGILMGTNNPVSKLGGRKGKEPKKPKPESIAQMVQEEIKVGIFAWAVLLGYGLFGEMFVARARGKGIAIHSGAINDFCKRFNIPNGLRQKYIQTAKRNGHDMGFLVDAKGLIGDGLFGKQAMAWWKAQGF
jgi:hypothetical protein